MFPFPIIPSLIVHSLSLCQTSPRPPACSLSPFVLSLSLSLSLSSWPEFSPPSSTPSVLTTTVVHTTAVVDLHHHRSNRSQNQSHVVHLRRRRCVIDHRRHRTVTFITVPFCIQTGIFLFSFKLWFMLIRINFNHNGGGTRGNNGVG
ncbi:hypothetical protein A2U01_0021441 [Trifolium medium]|uniref:Uncharacterized protein n=1 Tax=Trifolium medium TaxID=97028 RepID=A0A392NKU0_9FABA|nr:hypothetical protein [Trifolium medium]